MSTVFNMLKDGSDSVFIKLKLWLAQYFVILRQNTGIKRECQFVGRNHADDFPARPGWRQKACDKNIGVEDNIHLARFLRIALISALISSIDILSVPCLKDRR